MEAPKIEKLLTPYNFTNKDNGQARKSLWIETPAMTMPTFDWSRSGS